MKKEFDVGDNVVTIIVIIVIAILVFFGKCS